MILTGRIVPNMRTTRTAEVGQASLLTAKQAIEFMGRDRTSGRRALGLERFRELVANGQGPAHIDFDDGRPPMYTPGDLDAWIVSRSAQ